MLPTSLIKTSQHFEWDTPWSMGFLVAACVFFVIWTAWQLMREGRISQFRGWFFFFLLRTVNAGVLLWMILGPTTVLTQTETRPRTLAVYVDNSSSMQIRDQADLASDHRWNLAGDYKTHSLAAADRIVLFASALRQQTNRLIDSIDQQSADEERKEIATKWRSLEQKCREWLDSDILKQSLPKEQQRLHQELRQTLNDELRPFSNETGWIIGGDSGDREQRLQQLAEIVDQFLVRCRILAEGLAHSPIDASDEPSSVRPTRLHRVVPVIKQSLTEWQKDGKELFRVRLSQFAETVTPFENWESLLNGNEPDEIDTRSIRGTNMSDLLKQIRDDAGKEEIAAAVILTDGRHTVPTPDDPRDLVAQLRMPVFIVPIGHGEMKRDVILHHIHAPTSVMQNDKILIEGIVTGYRCSGEKCEVRLIEANKVIETRQISFKAEQDDERFRFDVNTDTIGRRTFTVEAEKLADENSVENNSKALAVDVVDAALRILLADGRARWEHQYLVNLFNRQEKVELDQLKFAPQAVGTGKRKESAQFPQTVQGWSDYRVVILGDISPKQLDRESQESLREYVSQRGGSLIIIAGQNEMPQAFSGEPLEQLLPVEANPSFVADRQGYRVEMTADGKTSDVMMLADDTAATERIWREVSASMPIYFLSPYNRPKPNSQVLLSAAPSKGDGATVDSPALFCWQTVGAGRVAYFSAPVTYLLRNQNGDKHHHRLWGQVVRWIGSRSAITGSKSVKLLADKSHYNRGDAAQLTVELSDLDGRPVVNAAPQIDVIKDGEVVSNVNLTADSKIPGRYLGSYAATETNTYSLRARGPDVERLLNAEKYVDPIQIKIDFEPGLNRELDDPRADRPLLEHLAEQTGGLVLEPTALAELHHAVSLEPRIQESSQRTPLWDRWWCLWVLLGCSTLEWMIRKRVGLA